MSDGKHHKQKTRPYVSKKLPPLKPPFKPKRPLLIVFAIMCVAVIVFVAYPESRIELFSALVSAALGCAFGWLNGR